MGWDVRRACWGDDSGGGFRTSFWIGRTGRCIRLLSDCEDEGPSCSAAAWQQLEHGRLGATVTRLGREPQIGGGLRPGHGLGRS